MKPQHRNPDGLATKKPIALRLMPDELAENKRISTELNCSKSSLAREAYLKGLPLVIADISSCSSTGLCGGSDDSDPAAFSSHAA